jgi:hypothetical protein
MMTPAEILESAADYMEIHGWTQGVLEMGSGEVCVRGAILRMDMLYVNEIAVARAEKILSKVVGYSRVHVWNDNICKSKYEAIDALRLAAKLAHEE